MSKTLNRRFLLTRKEWQARLSSRGTDGCRPGAIEPTGLPAELN